MPKDQNSFNIQMQLTQKWNNQVIENIPEKFQESKKIIQDLNSTDPQQAYRKIMKLSYDVYDDFEKDMNQDAHRRFFKSIYENDSFIKIQQDNSSDGIDFRKKLLESLNKTKIQNEFQQAKKNESGFARFMSLFTNGVASLKGLIYPVVYIATFLYTLVATLNINKALNEAADVGRLVMYNPLANGRMPFAQNCSLSEIKRVNFGHPLGTDFFKEKIHPAFKGYIKSTENKFFYIGNLKSPTGFFPGIEKSAERARELKIREYMGDNYCQLPADNVFLFNGNKKEAVLSHDRYNFMQNFEEHLHNAFFDNPHKNDIYIPEGLKKKISDDSEQYRKIIQNLMTNTASNFFQKSLNELNAEEQVQFKLFFFKAVLPNFLLQKSGCSSVGAACKDGIDRGNTTAMMMELFSRNYQFDLNCVSFKKKDYVEKIDVDILIQDSSLSAAMAKGRGVNEHRVVLDMFVQKFNFLSEDDLKKWNDFNDQFHQKDHQGDLNFENKRSIKIYPDSSDQNQGVQIGMDPSNRALFNGYSKIKLEDQSKPFFEK